MSDQQPSYREAASLGVEGIRRMFSKLSKGRKRASPRARRQGVVRAVEGLECRTLLSGDVGAFLIGDSLLLSGDRQDNAIEVAVEGGDLVVRGQAGTNTTVNGEPLVTFDGLTSVEDLRIFMRGGDDSVHIDQLTIADDLVLFGGLGDDAILVERSSVGDDASLFTSLGNDRVSMVNNQIADRLTLHTGIHDDLVFIDPTVVGGATLLSTGPGDDTVRVHGANEFAGKMVFRDAQGEDTLQIDRNTVFGASLQTRGFEDVEEVSVVQFSPGEGLTIKNFFPQGSPAVGTQDFSLDADGVLTANPAESVVNFSGGEVTFLGFGPAYASPPASYLTANGEIRFSVPVHSVNLSFVAMSGNPTATAFDEFGNEIGSTPANSPTFLGDPGNFVTFSSDRGIARIEISGGMTAVDNVAFVQTTEIQFSAAEGLAVRDLPAGDPPGTGSTEFELQGVHFSGGEVSFAGFKPAYASPPSAYLATEAQIRFEVPVTSVRFFFVNLNFGEPATATAFDKYGNVVATVMSNDPTALGDPANFVRLSGASISRIEISGAAASIDNLSFFPES